MCEWEEEASFSCVTIPSRFTTFVFYLPLRIRTDGYSGVKSVRGGAHGPRNYYSKGVIGSRFIAMHDHADFVRTVGGLLVF